MRDDDALDLPSNVGLCRESEGSAHVLCHSNGNLVTIDSRRTHLFDAICAASVTGRARLDPVRLQGGYAHRCVAATGPILGGCGTVGARSVRRPQQRRALDMARSIRSCPTGCAKCRMGRRPGWCWKHLQHQPCAPPLCRHVTANTLRSDLGRPRRPRGTANWAITREPSSRCYTASHAWMDVTRTSESSTVTREPETGGDTKARYRSYFTPSIPRPVNPLH